MDLMDAWPSQREEKKLYRVQATGLVSVESSGKAALIRVIKGQSTILAVKNQKSKMKPID